jgi:HK97 family phage prohead protease
MSETTGLELQPATERFFDALADVPNLRSAEIVDLDISDDGAELKFDGLAAVFGEVADLGEFTEEVERGAFRKVLASKPVVPFLHEHHPHQLLATTRSGRLRLDEDTRGLRVRANVVKTDLSERVKALVGSGDITGMSYAFVAGKENQRISVRGERPHRSLTSFKRLLDVSTTWNPAFVTTEAQFRSQATLYADSPELLQRLLLGAYPQLVELGSSTDRRDEDEEPEARADGDSVVSGVAGARSVAARRRALQFLVLTTGGIDDAS